MSSWSFCSVRTTLSTFASHFLGICSLEYSRLWTTNSVTVRSERGKKTWKNKNSEYFLSIYFWFPFPRSIFHRAAEDAASGQQIPMWRLHSVHGETEQEVWRSNPGRFLQSLLTTQSASNPRGRRKKE